MNTSMLELTPGELSRYSRHLIIPEVGRAGQTKIKNASVLLVGTGGLGSPAAYYLAAAGVGKIGLVDFDNVDATNLQRQILHFDTDVGRPKLQSASEKLNALNPNVAIQTYETRLTSENALDILRVYDIVVDGTDNFPTRYLVNDACVLLGKPNVYGSIFRFEGQAGVFWAEKGPCYRCLYPDPPPPGEVPSCADAGVLGVLPGLIGCIQANETLKLILGIGEPLIGKLLTVDALRMQFRTFEIEKDPNCPVCGVHPSVTKLIDYHDFCGVSKVADESEPETPKISVQEFHQRCIGENPPVLLDVREPSELQISRLEPVVHIPMGEVAERLDELDKEAETVVMCRTGQRSRKVAELLLTQGFTNVKNLEGGINAYAEAVDPTIPTY